MTATMSPPFQYDLPMRLPHSITTTSPPKRHFSHYRQPKVADVSRILDPSYMSSSSSSSPTSVYADTDGNLHDPDYRHFPVVAALPRRPAWERGADDDDELDHDDFDERTRLRSVSPRERRRARYSAYEQSLPHARRSFEEVIEDRSSQSRIRHKYRSRSHSPHHETSLRVVDEPDVILQPPKQVRYVPVRQEIPDWTPTCGQQFRRQWQAFTLSLRFSIFRAQRRIKRKFGA
ncbi:hypothetical protein B0F90DRAFT_792027 [Multifurca ochricompacta]|uniref:Uncharacterized protein n=1 Tax=Multifurca ochricompacta TaxID=376703 RepID=A0AAD4QQH3_9AGAM|nr:hypothetical protein B0F90DRAFT_792027 [Multifurca ochricompacta]